MTGLDCQSCVWPSPDKKRKIFEFCENGAKVVSDESTKKRITPEFFAQYFLEDLAAKSDSWLAGTSDVAHGASRQRDTLSADLLAGGLQNDRRRALFLNPLDMQAMNLKAGQIVDIYSHPEEEVRMAPRFAIVPYEIARRSAAAYYRRRMF